MIAPDVAALLAACRAATPDAVLLEAPGGSAALALTYEELAAHHPLAAARVIPLVSASPASHQFIESFPGPVLTKPFGMQRVAEALEIVFASASA